MRKAMRYKDGKRQWEKGFQDDDSDDADADVGKRCSTTTIMVETMMTKKKKLMIDTNLPDLCYCVDEEDRKKERKKERNYGNEEKLMPLKMAGYGRI